LRAGYWQLSAILKRRRTGTSLALTGVRLFYRKLGTGKDVVVTSPAPRLAHFHSARASPLAPFRSRWREMVIDGE